MTSDKIRALLRIGAIGVLRVIASREKLPGTPRLSEACFFFPLDKAKTCSKGKECRRMGFMMICVFHCMTSYKYVRSMEFNILAVKHSLIRDIPCLPPESASRYLVEDQRLTVPALAQQKHHIRYTQLHLA